MTINTQDGLLSHYSGSRSSTYSLSDVAGLRVRVKNPGGTNLDELTYFERVELARFLLGGLVFGAEYRLADFTDGQGGPNERADRLRFVDSFEDHPGRESTDLMTWVNHQDSSRLDGDWDERIKEYYAARGY